MNENERLRKVHARVFEQWKAVSNTFPVLADAIILAPPEQQNELLVVKEELEAAKDALAVVQQHIEQIMD